MCHYGKCIENACSYKMTNFKSYTLYFLTLKNNRESIRHCFFERIYKPCHIFYTWIGCIQGNPPILFSRRFIFTIDKHKYTSSYIYLTDFEFKFSWFTLESSHIIKAYPFYVNLDPSLCYVRYIFTLSQAKWKAKSKIFPPDSVSFINS